MGTFTCAELVTNARKLIRDADPDGDYEHTDQDFLYWIKEAHSVLVSLKPNANVVNTSVQLQPGTRQELPAGAIGLIRILNNMGADGNTAGPVITIIDRDTLDTADPGWHYMTAAADVQHYVFDEEDPTHFDVYPPQPDPAGYVRAAYPTNPSLPALLTDNITLDDIYAPVLTDFIVFRAFSVNGGNDENRVRAEGYWIRFTEALGVKRNIEFQISPNQGVLN